MIEENAIKVLLICALAVQCLAVVIFAESFLYKARNFREFTGILAGYKLLPNNFLPHASLLIVALECLAVVGILFALPLIKLLPALLLVTYALAMGINLHRGRKEISCGCGGDALPVSRALVARNILLALMIGSATASSSMAGLASMAFVYALLVPAVAIFLVVSYLSFNQLCMTAHLERQLRGSNVL